MLEKCFGAHRYLYNKSIDAVNNGTKANLIDLRNKILPKYKSMDSSHPEAWLKETPYDTSQLAIKHFVAMYKSASSNKKNGNIKKFEMKHLDKKSSQMCCVDAGALSTNMEIFKKRLKNNAKLIFRQKLSRWISRNIKSIDYDFSIIKDSANRYYICMPYADKLKQIPTVPSCDIVALDPGVRTFQTFYSPNGSYGKMGDNVISLINKYNERIDKLNAIQTKCASRTKYNINKRLNLLRAKVKNIVNDLHWKTASFLVKTYDCILLPEFTTSKMVRREGRVINSTTARNMLDLSHYKFKEKLKFLASCYNGKEVIICRENHTSKTCGCCGAINDKLGGSKKFNCTSCGLSIDRDINGARNIFIRSITKYSGETLPVKIGH